MKASYVYSVLISGDCELLTRSTLANDIPLAGEMKIDSKPFKTYEDCASAILGLLNSLCALLNTVSDRKHVVISKIRSPEDEEVDKTILAKSFVVDSKDFKKDGTLNFKISGDIRLRGADLELVRRQLTKTAQ